MALAGTACTCRTAETDLFLGNQSDLARSGTGSTVLDSPQPRPRTKPPVSMAKFRMDNPKKESAEWCEDAWPCLPGGVGEPARLKTSYRDERTLRERRRRKDEGVGGGGGGELGRGRRTKC
jgi:hypothetical protein